MTRAALDFAALEARLDLSPFHRWLALRLESLDAEGVALNCERREEMVGSVHTGALHGGLLGCLVDTAASFAVIARTGQTVATVDYRVNFHRPCHAARIRAEARIVHDGRTLSTVAVRILEGENRLVASGQVVLQHVSLEEAAARKAG
jgi:uncharacterized protein (TIGR00369 family)